MDFLKDLSLNQRKLIVGIDFGTTFSGISWAETRRSDHHFVIETWPAQGGTREGVSSVKVPTELRYTPKGTEWGFQIQPLIERHQWFKLGLADRELSGAGAGSGDTQQKTPGELTTDYLAGLYKHLMYMLEQKVGTAVLRTIPIEFCLTVPAIWSEAAKEKTLKACQKAGIESESEILLVSEPEAAAIYALHGLDPHGLSVGDSFVLCDAGGGTVDLISYTITALHPILKVEEAAGGTGALCGSTFLNRRFGEFLTQKLGGEEGWDDEILTEALERFESVIKKQYAPTADRDDGYTILVPGLANNPKLGIRRGRFTIKPAEIKDIFEPIILKIIELVKGQINDLKKKRTKAVLLVGGFGQNSYLKERLCHSLNGVEVLQPPNAWTAIVRGAVMIGLNRANSMGATVNVVSRRARKHYGVELFVNYDPLKHDDSKKYWCANHKCYQVWVMHWFIHKGDVVQEDKPQPIGIHSSYLASKGRPGMAIVPIFDDSDSPTAPVHRHSGVKRLVRLKADFGFLSQKDLDQTIRTYPDGQKYYHIPGVIEATFFYQLQQSMYSLSRGRNMLQLQQNMHE